MFSTTRMRSFLTTSGRMQSPACGFKFCGAWARVACVILAHASRVTFHGYFESTSTKQFSTKFFRSYRFISRQIPMYDGYNLL